MSHGARNIAKKHRQVTRKVRFSLEEKSDKSDCQEFLVPMVPVVPLIWHDSKGNFLKGVDLYLSNVILPIDAVPDETQFFKNCLAEKASNLPSVPLLPEFSEQPKVVYSKVTTVKNALIKATLFMTKNFQQ
jgi:hypothetical protein